MDKNLQFIEIIFESYPCQEKKSIYGSFLHVLINSFQASPASLKEETITLDCH